MTAQSDSDIKGRIDALIDEMTPEEKAGQLTQYFYFGFLRDAEGSPGDDIHIANQPLAVEVALSRGRAGALLFQTDPAEINRLQKLAIEGNRHRIPLLFGFDVIHGLRTIFPVPIAMAASWDPATIETGQAVAAREARAVGIHWAFAPMIDIARDPRWGRIIEGAGEDTYLCAAVAGAQVRGFQGDDYGAPDRVIAGPKHFAGYGAALGGRDYDEANISDYELWNVYFPPFQAAIDAGAGNIMTAYMDLNGIPATGNRWLLTDILRETWNFDGWVVSDANAVKNLETQGFARDQQDAGARALNAGCDMEMAIVDAAYGHLTEALEAGQIDEATLDASVRRVLEAKIRIGLFDDPFVNEGRAREVLGDPIHREEARKAAERAAVLLKNDGLLPLDPDGLSRVAVIGPLADSKRDTLGPWCFDFDLDETVTVLEGLRHRASHIQFDYAPGIRPAQRTFPSMFDQFGNNAPEDPEDFDDEAELERAIALAREADVAIVVVGEWQNMIGENASRASLDLPGRQLELLQTVHATGTPVVLLVMNGRPLDLTWASEHVPAILDIWYPGTRGGEAVANLIFGDATPGGRLPFTWPRSAGQVPMIYNHTRSHDPQKQDRRYWDEESTPLYPFGHGYTYGESGFRNIALDRDRIAVGESLTVTVEAFNSGDRDAEEVAQLYIHQRNGTSSRPVRELKGFQRVALEPGEMQSLSFTLGPAELRYWNAAERDWVQDAATFDVWIGGDSTATLGATFTVTEG